MKDHRGAVSEGAGPRVACVTTEIRAVGGAPVSAVFDQVGILRSLAREARDAFRHGLDRATAAVVAERILAAVPVDAVAVTDRAEVLAFRGAGDDHHRPGQPVATALTRRALLRGEAVLVDEPSAIGCPVFGCPLTAALVVPLAVDGLVAGALKLYRSAGRPFAPADVAAGVLLGEVLSAQLEALWLEEEAARHQRQALRNEISPHFLFHALTSAAAMVEGSPATARSLLEDLAELLRRILANAGEFWTLREELDCVRRYVALEQVRFGDRLRVHVEVQPEALDGLVPVLSVQPLVENAIFHGIAPRASGGALWVRAFARGDRIWIEVEDDGVGMPKQRLVGLLPRDGHRRSIGSGMGIGLDNVTRRLRAAFDGRAEFTVGARHGGGTLVRFSVPRTGP
jgi:LytS/YehU family sensor histidine kinase